MTETNLIRAPLASTAGQCRAMGLQVGDTIIGLEEYKGGWNEARLTVLWIGKKEVVFDEQDRSSIIPDWGPMVETCDWTLECREWRKISDGAV